MTNSGGATHDADNRIPEIRRIFLFNLRPPLDLGLQNPLGLAMELRNLRHPSLA